MASGFGNNGGPIRCYPFWQEVLACYVITTNSEDDRGKVLCKPALEDYYECLHHRKEKARVKVIQDAYKRAQQDTKTEDTPRYDEIRDLGLIKGTLEEKNIHPAKWLPIKSRN